MNWAQFGVQRFDTVLVSGGSFVTTSPEYQSAVKPVARQK
jgi:hypothetical protein